MEEIKTPHYEKVGVLKCTFSNLLKEGIGRMGMEEPKEISCISEIENLDLMIVTDEKTSLWEPVFLKCEKLGIPVMFAFNFGIGACLTVWKAERIILHPYFILDNRGKTPIKWMLDYTRGFNAFWNVTCHSWLDSVENWLKDENVKNSIGVYATSTAVIHTLSAMVYGEEIEVYPKFYLLSMANIH